MSSACINWEAKPKIIGIIVGLLHVVNIVNPFEKFVGIKGVHHKQMRLLLNDGFCVRHINIIIGCLDVSLVAGKEAFSLQQLGIQTKSNW